MGMNSPDQIWNMDEHGTEHAVKSDKFVCIKMFIRPKVKNTKKSNRTTIVTYPFPTSLFDLVCQIPMLNPLVSR